jgi:hypothetical protein
MQINHSYQYNLNKEAILTHARDRADRKKETVYVYVSPPIMGTKQNRWFARNKEEGQPPNSMIFCHFKPGSSQNN